MIRFSVFVITLVLSSAAAAQTATPAKSATPAKTPAPAKAAASVPPTAEEAPTPATPTAKSGKVKADGDDKEDKGYVTVKGTFFDFDETLLQGRFRAPNGLMLQGRTPQDKNQMVTLRKNFKNQILNSRAAVRSITP